MKIKNKSKKVFFAVFLLVTITGFGTLGIYGGPDNRHVYAQENNNSGGTGGDGSGFWEGITKGISNILTSIGDVKNSLALLNPSVLLNFVWRILIRYIFLGIPKIFAEVAGNILSWIIEPQVFKSIVGTNSAIYYIWTLVRDFLNMGFIMTLLFSAFCTIFQIEKYSFRKILLNLIIAAFLVNFSFPIARFIIDFSNVLMYYLVEAVGIKGSGLSAFTSTGVVNSLTDATEKAGIGFADLLYINMTGNVLMLLSITLLVIAVLFVIRTVMLVILIIFSPIAFVGMVVPIFSKYSDMWWDALIKYSFFGPIMIFMLYVALKLSEAMVKTLPFIKETSKDMSITEYAMAQIALASIPLITLWAGIIIAQKISLMGADGIKGKVLGFADTAAKKSLKWSTGVGAVAWGAKKSGISEGVSKKYQQFKQTGPLGPERTAQRGSQIAAALGVKGEKERFMKMKKKEYEESNKTAEELDKLITEGNSPAAALLQAENGKLEYEKYKHIMSKLDPIKDKNIIDSIETKTKEKRLDVTIKYKMETGGKDKLGTAKKEIGNIDLPKWKELNIEELTKDPTITKAMHDVYNSQLPEKQKKISGEMNPNKYAAGQKAGLW